jgi:hypothetical protein
MLSSRPRVQVPLKKAIAWWWASETISRFSRMWNSSQQIVAAASPGRFATVLDEPVRAAYGFAPASGPL